MIGLGLGLSLGVAGTPRDILLDNRERIDRLERQRLSPGG